MKKEKIQMHNMINIKERKDIYLKKKQKNKNQNLNKLMMIKII